MGTKIIVKGADFSECAVSRSSLYEESLIGSSQTLWNEASSVAAAGEYGALVENEGYVSGIIVKSSADGVGMPTIRIYENGSTTLLREYNVMPRMLSEGKHEYTFTSPVPVHAGEVVCISGAKNNYAPFYFNESGGDYPVSKNRGTIPSSGYRIYSFNFVMQTEIE